MTGEIAFRGSESDIFQLPSGMNSYLSALTGQSLGFHALLMSFFNAVTFKFGLE